MKPIYNFWLGPQIMVWTALAFIVFFLSFDLYVKYREYRQVGTFTEKTTEG